MNTGTAIYNALMLTLARTSSKISVRLDYSGRFMYGKTCIGFVGDGGDLFIFGVSLYRNYLSLISPEHNTPQYQNLLSIAAKLSQVNIDDMALDKIIYYPQLNRLMFTEEQIDHIENLRFRPRSQL